MSPIPPTCPSCGAEVLVRSGDTAVDCAFCGTNLRVMEDGGISPFFEMPAANDEPEGFWADAEHLLRSGRKIEAVKLLRENSDLGLKEAKDLVDELERSLQPEPSPKPENLAEEDWNGIRELVKEGKKIAAVRAYREATGAGLKEAKSAVEAIEGTDFPGVPGVVRSNRAKRSGGCMPGCAVIIGLFMIIFAGCGVSVRNSELYDCATLVIARDDTIRAEIGNPVRTTIPLVLGYSAESDFGGNTRQSFQSYAYMWGQNDQSIFYISALKQADDFYWVRANPIPNPGNLFIESQGSLSGCLE